MAARLLVCRLNVPIVSQAGLGQVRTMGVWGRLKDFFYKDGKEVRLADPLEHSTGEERMLRLAYELGYDDPYELRPRHRGPGTKDQPNLVPSFEDKRLLACLCEDDATHLNYLWIHKDEPRRCQCGYWFKWVPAKKFWEDVEAKYGPGSVPPHYKEEAGHH